MLGGPPSFPVGLFKHLKDSLSNTQYVISIDTPPENYFFNPIYYLQVSSRITLLLY